MNRRVRWLELIFKVLLVKPESRKNDGQGRANLWNNKEIERGNHFIVEINV